MSAFIYWVEILCHCLLLEKEIKEKKMKAIKEIFKGERWKF